MSLSDVKLDPMETLVPRIMIATSLILIAGAVFGLNEPARQDKKENTIENKAAFQECLKSTHNYQACPRP